MNKTSTFREKYQRQMPEKNSSWLRGFKNLPSLPSELLSQSHLQLICNPRISWWMGCMQALALTLSPVHFLRPGWIEDGHHPNYLPTRFLQFQLSPFPHSHAQAWPPILQCRLSTTVIKKSTYQPQRKSSVKIPSLRNLSPPLATTKWWSHL